MGTFIQQIINALVVGSFYSLIALGYSMVYGVIGLLNFAHGDLFMLGAFIGFSVLALLSGHAGLLGLALALLVAMILVGFVGLGIERVAYRPIMKKSSNRLLVLITAVGMSLVLENGVMLVYGPSFRVFSVQLPQSGFHVAGISISYAQVGIIVVSFVLMMLLQLFVFNTTYGKAMRSISIDQQATSLMGAPVYRLIGLTFLIGTALAAAAGVMEGAYYGEISFLMGFMAGLKAFTAAVIGGIGSIRGAMLGGLVLGVVETLGTVYVGSEWKDVFSFGILILVLVFKPTGLLGQAVTERV